MALVPLIAAVADSPPGRAAALGALWGVALAIGVAWWLPGMLVHYFGASWAAGGLGLLAAGALLVAPYSSAFAAWLALCARRSRRGPGLLHLALGWCAFEFQRAPARRHSRGAVQEDASVVTVSMTAVTT